MFDARNIEAFWFVRIQFRSRGGCVSCGRRRTGTSFGHNIGVKLITHHICTCTAKSIFKAVHLNVGIMRSKHFVSFNVMHQTSADRSKFPQTRSKSEGGMWASGPLPCRRPTPRTQPKNPFGAPLLPLRPSAIALYSRSPRPTPLFYHSLSRPGLAGPPPLHPGASSEWPTPPFHPWSGHHPGTLRHCTSRSMADTTPGKCSAKRHSLIY